MADHQSSPPQRLSRYRSQRRAQQQAPAEEAPEVPQLAQQENAPVEDTIARSKSRYHRKNNAESRSWTAQPATDVVQRPSTQTHSPPPNALTPVTSQSSQDRQNNSAARRHASPPAQLGAPDLRRIQSDESDYAIDAARRQQLNERGVKPDPEPSSSISPFQSNTQPTGELFPPPRPEPVAQPARIDGPPKSDQIRATKSVSKLPIYDEDDSEGGGCFGLFKRKRGEASPQAEKMPVARPLGNSILGTDAPISAVNAGDRRVLVECGKSKTMVPVTPTTTPVDVIKSAANVMSERIDVRSAVLLEYFGTAGVQRPLRRYEHIRDVMNSWDTDRQNSLLLVDPGTGSSEAELSIAGVPQDKPGEVSWLLSYSQKVGKWDKRLITLKPDGQMTQQKDPNKPKQQENVCHLSDFDIYTPTQEKLRRRIKPPKKMCFAIKSQQKTSMFEETQNFVHFFCTNDRATSDGFYRAVQGWRSWYLVNVMGEGRKPKPAAELTVAEKEMGGSASHAKGHRPGESFDSHYQLGSFKPLIDLEQFDNKRPGTSRSANAPPPSAGGFAKSASQFDTTVSPERRTSTARRKQHPPRTLSDRQQLAEDEPLGNLGRRASVNQKRTSMDQATALPDEFASSGLLGRSYSQRQREHSDRENRRVQPFTDGPNLLNGGYDDGRDDYARPQSQGGPRRHTSTRVRDASKTAGSGELRRDKSTRNRDSVDLGRSGSTRAREVPRPLVDLTPQYREPPQHVKKGKAYHPDQIGPGGLIDNATSPEDPLGIPPSTDWRGRNAQTSSPGTHQQDSRNRARSGSRNAPRPGTSRSRHSGEAAFTGEGLLAGVHGQQGRGGGDRGRGVVDGSHARGPLLDVHEPSMFTKGSLLKKVEREQGGGGP